MKKVITPIIHTAFLIPLLIIAMGSTELIARSFELLPDYIRVFEMPYIFITISIIILSGIPIYFIASRLLLRLEKLHGINFYDHIRQSIFYYIVIIYSLTRWLFYGFFSNEDDLYLLTMSAYSLIAIMINYILIRRRISNFT